MSTCTCSAPRLQLKHQSRYWTGLVDAPERPEDFDFKPISMADLRQSLDLAKFQAAADLVDGILEKKSCAVENFKAIAAMIGETEAGRMESLFYAGADAKGGGRVVFFAWLVKGGE